MQKLFFFLIVSSHMYVCSNQLGSVHNSPVGCVVGFSVFVSFVFLVLQATPKSSYGFVLFQTPSFIILFCVLETFVGLVFLCRVYCCVCQHSVNQAIHKQVEIIGSEATENQHHMHAQGSTEV